MYVSWQGTLTGIMVYVCTWYTSEVAMAHGQYHITLITFKNFYHIILGHSEEIQWAVATAVAGSRFQTYK